MSKWNEQSAAAWNESWSNSNNTIKSIGSLTGGLASVIGAGISNAELRDVDLYKSKLDLFGNAKYNTDNFQNLLSDYNNNVIGGMPDWTKLTGSTGEKLGNTLSATASGAMTGLQIGGPWGAVAGAAVGLTSGVAGWIVGDSRAKREADILSTEYESNKISNAIKFNQASATINDKMFNAASLNYRAYGGDLYDNAMIAKHFNDGKVKRRKISYIGNMFAYGGPMKLGGDWTNGVTIIGEGGTHEMNPYNGVQVGIDDKGVPNLVEEGEVIFNDYVYSNRLKPTEKQLDEVKLDKDFEGLTFAEAAKKISKESEERPNDPISKNGLIDGMMKLQAIQEEIRQKKAAAQFKRQFNKLSPEEQQAVAMQMMQPEGNIPMEETEPGFNFQDRYAANGNPQEQLGEEYGFANGGNLFADGNYLPYDNTKGFKYFNNGKYDQAYLDWLNSYDIDKSAYWSDLAKLYKDTFNKDLDIATARRLGQDKKFGQFHKAIGDAYEKYLQSKSTQEPARVVLSSPIDDDVFYTKNGEFGEYYYEDDLPMYGKNGQIDFGNSYADDIDLINAETARKPKTSSTKQGDKITTSSNRGEWLRYAPAIGSGIQYIADLFGANRPDYSKANMIGDAARRIRTMRAPQLYNYLRFNPYDVNYQQNRLQNMGLGTQRNILNTTSGNRTAALTALLLGNSSTISGMGDMYRTALEYNDNQRKTVSDFNRGTDQINLQSILSAEQANQNADIQRANFILQQAKMMDEIDTITSQATSSNRSNFYKNLGNIGNDNYYKNQTDWLIRSGWVPDNEQTRRYPRKNGGKIRKPKRMI